MRKRPTGRDVAERAGVSLTTVSFVLNGNMQVAIPEETRERVLNAARELGYRPNRLVRGLVRGKTQTIGLIVPRLDSSFHATVVQGIQSVCRTNGYRVLLADSEHCFAQERNEIELLLEHRVDGVISFALPDDVAVDQLREWVAGLVADGVAMVVVDDHSVAGLVDCVVTDDVRGARIAVEYLIQLGHRCIAHLSAGDGMSSSRDRAQGYREALERASIPVNPDLVVGSSYFMSDHEIGKCVRKLLNHSPRPTAVLAANDDLAAACIISCRERGMRVPEELSVAGYGDTAAGRYLDITTVQQDPYAMGQQAAQRLLQRLREPDLPPELIVLPVQLAVRSSTVPPRRNRTAALSDHPSPNTRA